MILRFFIFALLLSSELAFSGDAQWRSSNGEVESSYEALSVKWLTAHTNQGRNIQKFGAICPAQKNGGMCTQEVTYEQSNGYNPPGFIPGATSFYVYYCPDDKPNWEGGQCVKKDPCSTKAGMWDNGGSPQSVNLPGPLPFYSGETGGKIGMPDTICLNGCVADTTQDRGDGMSTSSWWGYNMNPKYNGQSCTSGIQKPGASKPKDSPEKKCVDQGMGFGYVNDKVLCVKPDNSSGTAKKSTETKNPDGTTTRVDTTTNISCNAEGACSTTTTTTTTVINADGSTASTKTETKKEDSQGNAGTGTGEGTSFCKENPTSPMCKSGSFNGSCAQAPACEGDPVQCATAKAVFEANCKALKPGDPPTTSEPVGEKKHQISFTPSELGGGGNCPANRSVTVMGKVINFDFSIMCQFALTIRPVVIAIGWLLAGYIVFGYRGKGS